ncbi:MAG: ABC transporter permease, partial [Lachnospiraceae bacterium]|nr:ABC transporter permease [Lachnospiraceae bacterium]
MWRDYSSGYIKNNRSAGLSVMIAAFISALLLSLLCGVFYNLWKYEVERIKLEDGEWQSRVSGEFDKEDIELIKNFTGVKDAVINEKESEGIETVVDICFYDNSAVLKDTPQIAELLGISPEAVSYHYELLAMYLIRSPQDTAPRLIFPMFILVTVMASFSLIIIIHNAFAVSMNARIHQFGIFSSIGATPKQIRTCLLQEAAALCAAPVAAGNLLGIAGSMGLLQILNVLSRDVAGRHDAVFGYHPLVLVLTLFVTVITIWISAWLPAGKLSRMTPLEAIKNTGELHLKRRKNSRVLALVFGVEGELAGNALKAQKKALRTSSLSLLLAFMAFTLM